MEGGHLTKELDGFQTPLEEKKKIADMLVKRYEDKQEYFNRINKRKQEADIETREKVAKVEKKL